MKHLQHFPPCFSDFRTFFYARHQRGPTHKFREREEARSIKKVCLLLEKKFYYKSLCMECTTTTTAFLNPTGGALVVFEEVPSEHTHVADEISEVV